MQVRFPAPDAPEFKTCGCPVGKPEPCCAVTAAPLFSADECAFIIEEAETKNGWVPQEFRYARDVVQQGEDLPEVRSWLEAACRDSLFPLLQRTFPEVVGAGGCQPRFKC